MTINNNSKISEIIKADSRAVDVLVKLNPFFKKLRNPVLRKVLAGRATIADAAKIGNCTSELILNSLGGIGFQVDLTEDVAGMNPEKIGEHAALVYDQVFDARPLLASGNDPFQQIMTAVKGIGAGQTLLLINSFEPAPLVKILKSRHFLVTVLRKSADLVETYITADDESAVPAAYQQTGQEFATLLETFAGKLVTIDVRALEMPRPMITILEKLEELPGETALYVHHKKVPVYLLPELTERHFKFSWQAAGEGIDLIIYPGQ
ncbi:DUF2249 domain-containing protein [Mucilaginibacter sp. HC2]|uniref:DUF2249 domain-containing protein n=1 Tax=Mucilaginibacter inviolabilis TaxID=2714892 RepID=UPI00140BA8B7|nr:DUF2249 domain-containing protein [Mucilaginibacter inviolabilis]NHA02581.1 DUF2249 domain-containing protein [Mucilaginibacter inviolabilis]